MQGSVDTGERARPTRSLVAGVAAVGSGLLMAASFPPLELWQCAWVALTPLILLAVGMRPAAAFRWGWLSGMAHWLVSLAWLLRLWDTAPVPAPLIVLGWSALSAYCALYTGAFAFTVAHLASRIGTVGVWRRTLLTVLIPVLWVGFEFVRANAFQGFAWNPLGVSQFRNLPVLQIAQWFGVYGVSALLVLSSAGLAMTLLRLSGLWHRRLAAGSSSGRLAPGYQPHPELFLPLLAIALAVQVGMGLARLPQEAGATYVVAAIQPAVPQEKKWSEGAAAQILARLREMTEDALRQHEKLDLIIWPETATPECVRYEGESHSLVLELVARGVPLLVGSLDVVPEDGWGVCRNSAFLYTAADRPPARYDKQRLVPFGEYIPLDGVLPFLRRVAPLGWSCVPGRRATVFRAGDGGLTFSTLICFEDTVADICREFVRRGARLLVNQTNDAWFDRTAAPVQHLSHCVLRCVENRVPAIRAANSGITCLIDARGALHDPTANSRHVPPRPEVRVWSVAPAASGTLTFYTRYGDMPFALPSAAVALSALAAAWLQARRSRENAHGGN